MNEASPSPAAIANPTQLATLVERDGFAVVDDVVSPEKVHWLRAAIANLPNDESVRRKVNVYGVRNLLDACSAVREIAAAPEILSLVSSVLGPDCFAVRATFFDKVAGANWNLRWHQDGVISVKERIETDGFTAWADKAGVWQVRPPEKVLAGMLAIRLHLDDCPREERRAARAGWIASPSLYSR